MNDFSFHEYNRNGLYCPTEGDVQERQQRPMFGFTQKKTRSTLPPITAVMSICTRLQREDTVQ